MNKEEAQQKEEPTSKLGEDESFTVVKARKTRKNRRPTNADVPLRANFNHDIRNCGDAGRIEVESHEEVLRKVTKCTDQLRTSDYFPNFLEKITSELNAPDGPGLENISIFCLGLGPFSSHLASRIARYQLGLLVLLNEHLQASVEVYDPIFTPQEKHILTSEFGFTISEENEEGKRVIESPTVIFLPHCPHQLVNNLLYANWNSALLQNCYIVCNSLSEAISTNPSKYLETNLLFLPKAHAICTEVALANTFTDHPDVFNDLALHVFPPKSILDLSEEFWLDKPCPFYADQDFISNESKLNCDND